MMINTPLLLDFSNKLFPVEKEKIVPTSEEELVELREAVMSSPKYFLKIFYPENFNQYSGLKFSQLQINIPLDSVLNNQVRLTLSPSIGDGINACYRVEYWQWQKPFYPKQTTRVSSKITKTKVFEEYWKIPTLDKVYIRDYYSWKNYKPVYKYTSTASLIKEEGIINSLLNNLDIISIQTISQENNKFTNYKIVDDSLFWIPPFELLPIPGVPALPAKPANSTVGIQWLEGDTPIGGESYEVTYTNPLSLEDIVYIDLLGTTVKDNHSTNYIQYPNTIIPLNYYL